jgi:tRNA (guanine-N7-)-methyltransferase
VSKRVRHHVNPLGLPFSQLGAARLPVPDGVPVEVELGCADARFLFDRAPRHPRTHFIGLEIREPLVDEVNALAAAQKLSNLSACFCNINVDLDALFTDGRLARVFVNFPDPWFKRRHHKRRVMNEELADVLFRKLAPGGELFFQSDVFDLALDAMAVLEASRFTNRYGAWTFVRDNRYDAKSLREVRCEERGMRIWRMLYDRGLS